MNMFRLDGDTLSLNVFIPLSDFQILMIGLNLLRYLMLREDVGHWTEMFIVLVVSVDLVEQDDFTAMLWLVDSCVRQYGPLQVHAALPLTTLATPLMWRLIDLFGVAKILVVFKRYRQVEPTSFPCTAFVRT